MLHKEFLRGIPLFNNLNDDDLRLIAGCLRPESYPKGTVIFREGDFGDTMYVVESGQVVVFREATGEKVATLGPGTFVGEISLLLGQPRTASLEVALDAQLWALNKQDFEALVSTRPAIALEMTRELSKRLVRTTRRRRPHLPRRITALLGSQKALALGRALQTQLKSPIGVLPLPGAAMAGAADITLSGGLMFLGHGDLTVESLAESLSYQVEVFKHILLILPDEPDPLAQKAVDLADTVVSIGPPPAWISSRKDKKDVWQVGDAAEDPSRIARRLTGRTVGLALSSGGSRGLAHIGVIKVLLEEKIPVDLVAGTSAGAWFSAFYALGWDWPRFARFTEEIKSFNRFPNWDFNIPPRTAILKGRLARDRIINRSVEGRTFAEVKTPLYIVAADIFTGEEVVFDSGPLADAIRASLSLPVLVDPWQYQGRFLVDGGIVNPLPASVLRERGADIVIASSVVQPMRDSFSGRKDRRPSILQVVFNMFSAMEAEVIDKQLPLIDVLIHHKVAAKHSLDFEQVHDLVRMGEESARRMLPEIKAAIESPPEG
ncbi:MAG: patatin-like phospholipase family protein [Anaerolineae bacterium]|nr:patatin-like phospholipase family protein [Anaerolineae bacterium]